MINNYLIWSIVAYIIVLLIITVIVRAKQREKTMKDFFLAGRSLGPLLLTFTLFATLFSAFTVVGMPGFFYTHGIGTWAFAVFGDLLIPFVIFYFGLKVIKINRNSSSSSPIELLTHMYQNRAVSFIAMLLTVILVLPYFALQIAGMGKLLSATSGGGISYLTGAGIMLIVMFIYSEYGGLRADVWTDLLQGGVMLAVMIYISFSLMSIAWDGSLGMMFNDVIQSGKADLLSIPGPEGFFTYPILISFLVFFILIPITQPQIAVRFIAASSKRTLLYTMLMFPILTLIMFIPSFIIGVGGAGLVDVPEGDMIMGEVLNTYFPPWLIIVFVIGVVAASMSTTDSILISLGSIFARDIYVQYYRSDASDSKQLRAARLFMFVLMVGGFILALNPPDLIVKLAILNLAGLSLLAPTYIGGVIFRCKSSTAAISSMIVGVFILLLGETVIPKSWFLGFHSGLVGLLFGSITYYVLAKLDKQQ